MSPKARGVPYTDDGKPVRAKMGRPSKGDLTEDEFWAIVPVLAKPRKTRGGSLEAAARVVSQMRGAHVALTPRVAFERSVSARWVSFQLAKRGFSGKKSIQEKVAADPLWLDSRKNSIVADGTGPRAGYREPSGNPPALLNAPVSVAAGSAHKQVDSERKEAKA